MQIYKIYLIKDNKFTKKGKIIIGKVGKFLKFKQKLYFIEKKVKNTLFIYEINYETFLKLERE